MTRPHLLAVWNPTYGRDPMEAHLRVLRQAVREFRAGECGEDGVFVVPVEGGLRVGICSVRAADVPRLVASMKAALA